MRNAAGDCGQAVPLNKGIDERNLKSRRNGEMLFAIPKTKKLQANYNLRKIHRQFGQRTHRRTTQRQTAKRFCRMVQNDFP